MDPEIIIDTPVRPAPPQTPGERARYLTDADLRSQATPAEVAWLHQNPRLWLRALVVAQQATRAHIGRDRTRLKQMRLAELAAAEARGIRNPQPGPDYLAEAVRVHEAIDRRQNFEIYLRRRISEVETLFGDVLNPPLTGEVVTGLLQLADMTLHDATRDQIRAKALTLVNRLTTPSATDKP